MRYIVISVVIFLQGCSSTIAVRTLESTIRDAATVAQAATQGASEKIKIEVSVTNGYKAGGTLPIPVVPLNISKSSSTSTKLTLEVDLKKFKPMELETLQDESEIFVLDTRTGILSSPNP